MNFKTLTLLLALFCATHSALAAVAITQPVAITPSVLVSGNSMDSGNTTFTSSLSSVNASFQFVAPASFSATSTAGYNVIWLDGFSNFGNDGTLNSKLSSFLTGGGTVIVQSPGFGTESLATDYPLGSQLSALYTYPPGENLIRLLNTSNPLNAGLTGSGLSGWNASAAGIFTTVNGPFTILADNGSGNQYITIYITVGSGNLIYTQLGVSQRLSAVNDPQAITFLNNIVAASVPEPASLALLAFGGLLLASRRSMRGLFMGSR
ncbi:MAG: PEP-CTERM sorting domain-containing protein [Verrucomicrobia bacterium]|nr:PEP-CTERM sorting domain-containing protein [Verrucomicrobiota bacterium]